MEKEYLTPLQQSTWKVNYVFFFTLVVAIGFGATKALKNYFDRPTLPSLLLNENSLPSSKDLKFYLEQLNPAQKKEVDLIARTIFGEARGEKSSYALRAIAHVILNRTRDRRNWPNSVQAVILQKNQFSCWNETDPNYYAVQSVTFNNSEFRQAYQAALVAMLSDKDITHGANHYHAKWVNPLWAHQKNMIRVAEIQQHIFYKA